MKWDNSRAILECIGHRRKGFQEAMEQRRRRKHDSSNPGEFFKRFGSVAVHKGFTTIDQVKNALADQVEDDVQGREHRLIGAILFDKGWITEEQIEQVLRDLHKSVA